MQSGNKASAPADEFETAFASLRYLVESAQRESQKTSDEKSSEAKPSDERPQTASDNVGTPASEQGTYASGSEANRTESFATQQGRQPRLTDVLASGIHEVTQHVGELIDANRAAHTQLFGPLSLPPRAGGPRPGASSSTADGHLAGAMWQLRESIKELQAVSQALLSRI
jgi:hypothetical protein